MFGWFRAASEPRLLLEAPPAVRVSGELSRQDLDRDDLSSRVSRAR